jgi:hypothetical protein
MFTALGVVDLQKSRSCSVLWNFISELFLLDIAGNGLPWLAQPKDVLEKDQKRI